MVRYIDCDECGFHGEVDTYNTVTPEFCPGCGTQLGEVSFSD